MHVYARILDRELKKGSAELVILALVEHRPRHGYEMSQIIERRSEGAVRFKVASLYPLLYRLEKRGWIAGRWVEKAAQRRRRYYRITPEGRRVLADQRRGWDRFVAAITARPARTPPSRRDGLCAGVVRRSVTATMGAAARRASAPDGGASGCSYHKCRPSTACGR